MPGVGVWGLFVMEKSTLILRPSSSIPLALSFAWWHTKDTYTKNTKKKQVLNCKTSKVKLQCASFRCYLSRHGLVPLWRLLCSQSKQKQSPWIGATAGHIRSWRLPGGRISRRHPSGPSPWCTSSGQKLRGKGLDPDLPVNFTFSMWIQWHTNFKKTGQSTDKFITSLPQCAC